MSVRIVRASSDVSTVFGKDDALVARYAYGADYGVVKYYQGEVTPYIPLDNRYIGIHSGRVVVYGWEVDIDREEFILQGSFEPSVQALYLLLTPVTETAHIYVRDITNLPYPYPLIEGDDLTSVPGGTAQILLASVQVDPGGYASSVDRGAPIISPSSERIEDLGFIEGVITPMSANLADYGTVIENWVIHQGDLAFGNFHVQFDFAACPDGPKITVSGEQLDTLVIAQIPRQFAPDKEEVVPVFIITGLFFRNALTDNVYIQTSGDVLLPIRDAYITATTIKPVFSFRYYSPVYLPDSDRPSLRLSGNALTIYRGSSISYLNLCVGSASQLRLVKTTAEYSQEYDLSSLGLPRGSYPIRVFAETIEGTKTRKSEAVIYTVN